jgi:hypothetical protein
LAGDARDELTSFQFDDHAVDAGRRDAKEALEVGLGGRSTVDQGVRVDRTASP